MANKGNVSAKWEGKQMTIILELPFFSFIDNGFYVLYCPALDLTGYGKTPEAAENSFTTVMNEYFTYTTNKNTLIADLQRLGWKTGKSKNKPFTPPLISDLIATNESFTEIINNYPFTKYDRLVAIPA